MRITASVAGRVPSRFAVFAACRGVGYELLRRADGDLAEQIHAKGWQGDGRRPWSMRPPLQLTAGERSFDVATPIGELGEMFLAGLQMDPCLDWGSCRLDVTDVSVEHPVGGSEVVTERWITATPTIVQGPSPRRLVLVPGDPGWEAALSHRLTAAAGSLGLKAPNVRIVGVGDRVVSRGDHANRVGAEWVALDVTAPAGALEALAALGVGTRTTEGFGFVGVRKQIDQRADVPPPSGGGGGQNGGEG